LNNTKYKVY